MIRQGLSRQQLIDRGLIVPAWQRRRTVIEAATLRLLPGERERFEREAIEGMKKHGAWGRHPFDLPESAPEEKKMRRFALAAE